MIGSYREFATPVRAGGKPFANMTPVEPFKNLRSLCLRVEGAGRRLVPPVLEPLNERLP